MARLEDLQQDTRVRGVTPRGLATVKAVEWFGDQCVQVTYAADGGDTGQTILYRDDEARLEIETKRRLWSFDGDGTLLRLVSEAYRIHLAWLFDPYLAITTSTIDPLPHQISAVYEQMLPRQPMRFLLADDPGAGKTIMAGLLVKELIIRGDLQRCLVVAPGSLTEQWQDELYEKFELQTNFGGGKTHSMLALYHLLGAAKAGELPGIEPVLQEAETSKPPEARRAVLVGTALSPGEAVKKPDGTEVHTLWGELAWQLGGERGYKFVAESDRAGTSPGSDALTALFREFSPCLVLIDEWVAYARQLVGKQELPGGSFEAQASFAQALTEAARAAPKTLVVASIPASKIEIGGEHGEFALDALKNVFERVGKAWRPATGDEGFEIVRRRLFEPIVEKDDFAARDAVVDAFSRMYRQNTSDFPAGCAEETYRRELEAAYPIHPDLFRRLYEDWSTLDKFQRTRGVLRLLAKVIHRLWEDQDSSLLILPSSVPLNDGAVKSELTRYLEDLWEPIISQDIDGPNSLPLELDRSTPNLGRYSACRRVARTLYMGTAPGSQGRAPGIDDRRVTLGCAQPGESNATFGDALRRLGDRAHHIHQEGNRYWVSPKRNLNRVAEDEANALLREPAGLYVEIARRLRADRTKGDFAGVHPSPDGPNDVPDEMEARLVILGPKHAHRRDQEDSDARKFAQEVLESKGTGPRIYQNTLVFVAPDKRNIDDLLQATAHFLAWQTIADPSNEERYNLDAYQRRQADTKTKGADETVNLRISNAWQHILVPMQRDPAGPVTWEELRSSSNESLAKRVSSKLKPDELLMPVLGAQRLRKAMDQYNLWAGKGHVSFRQLFEYFARYLYLPRVVGRETLAKAVQNGAEQLVVDDTFAIATDYDEQAGRYKGLCQGKAINLVVDNDTLLVKPDVAAQQAPSERPSAPPSGGDGDGAVSEPASIYGGGAGGQPATSEPKTPTVFVGSVKLKGDRIGRDAGRVAEEVVQHLSTLQGAEVDVTLEIQVRVPGGIKEDVVRTVSENSSTLKFESANFERE